VEKQKSITENTLVPISLLVTLLLFSAWLTTVWAQGLKNAENIDKIEVNRKEDVQYFRDQVEKMNDKLDRILEKK
jgi:hypothetical protein